MDLKATQWFVDSGVAVITLSRPARHNAWTGRMHTELRHLLQVAEDDPSIRVLVITGDAEGQAFCPGADSQALKGHVERGGYDPGTPSDLASPGYGVREEFDADFAYFLGMETVTIAALNGAAAGVGLALACWCDLRLMAAGTKLTAAHGKLNLPAEYGLAWLLPRLIGHGRASEILLTSRVVLAEEALNLGLVNSVHPADQVFDAALAMARQLVSDVSPGSLRATKRQLAEAMLSDPASAVVDAQTRLDAMATEADYGEAIAAFVEKRPPRWTDS